MSTKTEETRQTRCPRKTWWWDCVKNEMKSFGLSQDAHDIRDWRVRIKGAVSKTQVYLQMAIKWFVFVQWKLGTL